MKKFLSVLAILFLTTPLFAETPDGRVIDLLTVGGVTSIAVPGTAGSTFSNSFPMANKTPFTLAIQSTATSKFTVALENGFARPTTEGTTDSSNYANDSTTSVLTISDTALHIYSFTATVSPFARLKFTGLTGNSVANTISVLKVYVPSED